MSLYVVQIGPYVVPVEAVSLERAEAIVRFYLAGKVAADAPALSYRRPAATMPNSQGQPPNRHILAPAAERVGVDWRELRDAQDAATIDNAAQLDLEIEALLRSSVLVAYEPKGRKYTY